MRRPGGSDADSCVGQTTMARGVVTVRLLPLRSGSDKPQICCLSPSKAGRSHPAAYRDGPILQSVTLLELPHLQTSRVPVVTRLTRQSRVEWWYAGSGQVRVLAGRSGVPTTPSTPTCTVPVYLSFPSSSRPLPLLSSSYHYYRHCLFPQIFQKETL